MSERHYFCLRTCTFNLTFSYCQVFHAGFYRWGMWEVLVGCFFFFQFTQVTIRHFTLAKCNTWNSTLSQQSFLAHICGKWMFYLGSFLLCVGLQECFVRLDRMCLVFKVLNWAQLLTPYRLSWSELVFLKSFASLMCCH